MRKVRNSKAGFSIVALIFLAAGVFMLQNMNKHTDAAAIQQSIAGKILRFHVIANSDKPEDQALKLKVRDRALAYIEPLLKNSKDQKESEQIIEAHLSQIKQQAELELQEQGSDATVNVSVQNRYFPVKEYGDLVFPEGEYEALCIEIGASEGKNWWCVLYPKLCFVDSLYAVVPDESKEELKTLLTQEEYEAVMQSDEKIVVKSRIVEWVESFWK